jgi:PAS domain S-box-containing protein
MPDFSNTSFAHALGTSPSACAIVKHDWSTTSIGAANDWPAYLKTSVAMMVRCPTSMVLMLGETGLLIYNEGYAKIVGDRHPDALGCSVLEVWPEAAEFNQTVLTKVLAGESLSYRDSKFLLKRNGALEQSWFDLDYSPVTDESGTIFGVLAVVVEKTNFVLVTQQLEREREQFGALFEQAPSFMAILRGPHHYFEHINPGYAKLIGHRPVIGFTAAEALPEAAAQGYVKLLDEVYESGSAISRTGARYALQTQPDGAVLERFVDFVYQPIKNEHGVVTSIFVEGVDVTERETVTAAKRDSDATNRQIIDSAIDYGIIAFDLVGKVTRWNEGARRILGWTEQEMLGQDGSRFFTPEDRIAGCIENEMRNALSKGVGNDERWHMRKSGERFWAAGEMTPLIAESGVAIGFVKVLRDRTEQHLAAQALRESQQALRESDAQFRTLAQVLPNHVWTAKPDGQLEWFNERAIEFSGATQGALKDGEWASYLHPADKENATALWKQCIASGTFFETEFRLKRSDGQFRWYLVRALPLRTDEGLINAWVGTNTDIHERKLLEAESTRDRDRIWKLSQELMMVCDRDGVISAVNPATTQLLGWSEEEMVGSTISSFLHPGDIAKNAIEFEKLGRGLPTLAFENRYRGQDGSYRLLSWIAVSDGGMIHTVARDLTRERAAEEALRQSQKLEAIGQLTGGVAHDFNNVLAVMRSSVDLLRLVKLTDERRQRYLSAISDAITRATKLTGQLLAFARRQALQPVVFDVRNNIEMISDMLDSLTGPRIVREIKLDDFPCLVDADPNQFDTAIVNLTVNARDAMEANGKLTISVARVEQIPWVRANPPVNGNFVAVTVADTGIGIAEENLTQIFEPFFTTKGIGQGTGLGLSQVFGFAKQSGGEILVESRLGAGTAFTLYLPLSIQASTYPDSHSDSHPDSHPDLQPDLLIAPSVVIEEGAGGCVLVVEDNENVALSVLQSLQALGYATLVASSAEEALVELSHDASRFVAVFSDIAMGGMSGIELGEWIRSRFSTLPVVLSSGYSHDLATNTDHGFTLLPKPYALEQLATTLNEAIGGTKKFVRGTPFEDTPVVDTSLLINAAERDKELMRLATLDTLGILDSDEEQAYDELTMMAAKLFDVPIVLISLVDAKRQWFKSRFGLQTLETPREHAFCNVAIQRPSEVMLIQDASKDKRFAAHPLVQGDPQIRFYAGAPLVTTTGHVLGTLCIIDRKPRTFHKRQLDMLQVMAAQIIERIEARAKINKLTAD